MGLKNILKKGYFLALLFIGITINCSYSLAQVAGTGTENDAASVANTEDLQSVTSEVYKSAGFYFLLFVLLCFFIAIIGKVLRVYELTREVQGSGSKINWNKIQSYLFLAGLIVGLYGSYWCYTTWSFSEGESGSVHGSNIDFMLSITLITTTIVFVITHILLFGFSFKYRGSDKRKAYFYPHNNAIERLWTIIPAIALTVMVLLGFFAWRSITNISEADQKKALSIEVTGEQFKWNIRYAGADNQLGVRNYKLINPNNNLGIDFKDRKSWDDKLAGEIVIPVNRPVRVTINSKDVLHGFFIPAMRVQIYAVPGMPTHFQFTPKYTTEEMRDRKDNPKFDYTLLCAQVCGAGHYNMQTKVTVVTEKEYAEWIAKQQLFFNDDVKKQLQMAGNKAETPAYTTLAVNK